MLPQECYLHIPGKAQIEAETNEGYYLDHVQSKDGTLGLTDTNKVIWYDEPKFSKVIIDGIYVFVQDAPFPIKGAPPSPEIIFTNNTVKAIFIESLKTISQWYFIPSILILAFSVKKIQKVVDSFNRLGWKILSPYLLKDRYLTPFDKTLHFFIFTFLYDFGLAEQSCDMFATLFVHLIAYDNAYRLRIQDIFSETSTYKLRNPRKELQRLGKLIVERDTPNVSVKTNSLIKLIRLALCIPKVKRAFREAITSTDISLLGYDDAERYWVSIRTDYKFMGLTLEQRQKYAQERGWTFPTKIDIL